jgi:hypothetical protein
MDRLAIGPQVANLPHIWAGWGESWPGSATSGAAARLGARATADVLTAFDFCFFRVKDLFLFLEGG